MEIKLNLLERALMKLSELLFCASGKVAKIVFKRRDKDLCYESRTYYPDSGTLVLKEMRRES